MTNKFSPVFLCIVEALVQPFDPVTTVTVHKGSYFFKITVNKRFYDYFNINLAELLTNYKLPTNRCSNFNTKSNKHRLHSMWLHHRYL